jgi:hypothetical protein
LDKIAQPVLSLAVNECFFAVCTDDAPRCLMVKVKWLFFQASTVCNGSAAPIRTPQQQIFDTLLESCASPASAVHLIPAAEVARECASE